MLGSTASLSVVVGGVERYSFSLGEEALHLIVSQNQNIAKLFLGTDFCFFVEDLVQRGIARTWELVQFSCSSKGRVGLCKFD